jgi:type II secretory pathway pseudopilin PulG
MSEAAPKAKLRMAPRMANCNPLRSRRSGRGNEQRQRGFTYLGVLFAIVLLSAGLLGGAEVWHTAQKREKERELLFVGNQFRVAIASYYDKSPGGIKRYPETLSDLLKDKRFPFTQRHLRKIYSDPITRKRDWGLVKAPEGGIMGIYSLSEQPPIKVGNFSPANDQFKDQTRYSDWKFVHAPQQRVQGASQAQPGT